MTSPVSSTAAGPGDPDGPSGTRSVAHSDWQGADRASDSEVIMMMMLTGTGPGKLPVPVLVPYN